MRAVIGVIFLAAFIFSCQPAKHDPWAGSEPLQRWCHATFQSDSGFVNISQQQVLEELICQTDTSILPFEHCSLYTISDTSIKSLSASNEEIGGKYYRVDATGLITWVLCLNVYLDGWENPYVFEIEQRKDKFTIASWAHYIHGSYACCWNGPMGGFYRLGPYIFIETCGRGSGFCAGEANMLFFPLKDPSTPGVNPPGIPVSWFQSGCAWPEYLNSRFLLKNDTIVVDYEFERDSTIVLDQDRDTFVPLKHDYFQALFKAEPAARNLRLLNRDAVLQHREVKAFLHEFK